jgi:hypothetical protein
MQPFRPKRNPVLLGQVARNLLDDPRSPFFPFAGAIKKSMREDQTEPAPPSTPSQLTLFSPAASSQRDQVTARDRRLNHKRNGNGNGH